MNLPIKNLEIALINTLNASNIPTEVKRLVVLEVLMKLEAQANKEIALELQSKEKENKKHELQTDNMGKRENSGQCRQSE